MAFAASQIPIASLLALGTEAQAQNVLASSDLGSTILMIEREYGGLSFFDHFEVTTRLGELRGLFNTRVAEMSGPLPKMHSLHFFFDRVRFSLAEGGFYPALLSDFLMHRAKNLVPPEFCPALLAVGAHLAAIAGANVVVGSTPEDYRGLFSAEEGLLLTFHGERTELVLMPESPHSEPLLSIVSEYLLAMAKVSALPEHAERLRQAAQVVYSRP